MGIRFTWTFLSFCYIARLDIVTSNIYLTGSKSYLENDKPFILTCRSDNVPYGTSVNFFMDGMGTFNVVYASSLNTCYGVPQNGEPAFQCTNNCSCSEDLKTYTWTYTGIQNKSSVVFRCQIATDSTTTTEDDLVVEVIDPPDRSPVITQSPAGPIISGNKVTLTCSVSRGNPLAVLSWNCTGNYNNNTSGDTASYSVDFTVDKTYNNLMCTCSGSHPVSSYRPTVHHRLVVYYSPDSTISVDRTPKGVVVPGTKVGLTCTVSGGYPLPSLFWDCSGTYTNKTSGNTASYSVEFTTDTTYNRPKLCNCSAAHIISSYRPIVQYELEVFCSSQSSEEDSQGISAVGISSLAIGIVALVTAIIYWSQSSEEDSQGISAVGISSLAIGIVALVTAIIYWYFRLKQQRKSKRENYSEFKTISSTERNEYDVIHQTTNTDTNTEDTGGIDNSVNTYEELQPDINTVQVDNRTTQNTTGSQLPKIE